MSQINMYLKIDDALENEVEAGKIRSLASSYLIIDKILYKK